MLIKCEHCGKPVYARPGQWQAECSYCYRESTVSGCPQVVPDWKKPLTDYLEEQIRLTEAGAWPDPAILVWLYELGDYRNSGEILTTVHGRLLSSLWHDFEGIQNAEQAERFVRFLDNVRSFVSTQQYHRLALLCGWSDFSPKESEEDWKPDLDSLLEKAQARRLELIKNQEHEALKKLEKQLASADYSGRINTILEQLASFSDENPEAQELIESAKKKLALTEEKERREAEEERRKKKRRRTLRLAGVSFAFLLLFICTLYKQRIAEPRNYQKADSLFTEKNYAEAAKILSSLSSSVWFPNWEVKKQAQRKLRDVNKIWADELVSRGDYWLAALKYSLAGEEEAADRTLARAHLEKGQTLEEEGDLEGAITEYICVEGQEKKIQSLYGKIGERLEQEGDLAGAVENYRKAFSEEESEPDPDNEAARRRWERANLRYAVSLRNEGKLEESLEYFTNAGDDPETLLLKNQAEASLGEAYAMEVLEAYRRQESETDELSEPGNVSLFLEKARGLGRLNAILRYCSVLDEHGIDLSGIFPDGIAVYDVWLPPMNSETSGESQADTWENFSGEAYSGETETENVSAEQPLSKKTEALPASVPDSVTEKLLVLTRTESVPDSGLLWSGEYIGQRSCTIRFQPELWQMIPAGRRAGSSSECTGVILGDSRFDYSGKTYGTMITWDYALAASTRNKQNRIYTNSHYPFDTYRETDRVLIAAWPFFSVWEEKSSVSHSSEYSLMGKTIRIDMTQDTPSQIAAAKEALAGKPDPQWLREKMEYTIKEVTG